ncbi:MAG: oligosaccharide flippase family protein [Bacteroidetes bacterium]|nr:oligosaccharide flippase family protein [Bacteroidota bacterium]
MNIKNWLIGKLAIVGKFTRTDIKYLVRGGFWLSTKSIISIVISLFTAIAFANFLSQDIYGIYKYIITIIALLALSSLSGMGSSVTRAVARGYVGSLIPAIKTSIKWGLLGSLASIAISIYYFVNGNLLLGTAFVIASIFIPFRDSLSLYQSFLGGKKMFKKMSRYTIISNIVAAASLMAALFLTRNILFLVFAYLAPRIILNFIFLQKYILIQNILFYFLICNRIL